MARLKGFTVSYREFWCGSQVTGLIILFQTDDCDISNAHETAFCGGPTRVADFGGFF